MLPSLVYAVVRPPLDLALLRCRRGAVRDLELLALRHEVRVLRRRTKRIAWRPGDRLVLTALSRCPPALTGMRSLFGRRPSCAGTGNSSAASGRCSPGAAARGAPTSRPSAGT
jgi:hypothetical protein